MTTLTVRAGTAKCPPGLRNVNSRVHDEMLGSAGASPAVSRATRDTFGSLLGGGAEKGGQGRPRSPKRSV